MSTMLWLIAVGTILPKSCFSNLVHNDVNTAGQAATVQQTGQLSYGIRMMRTTSGQSDGSVARTDFRS